MPYTDRIDYVAAMFANEGYALASRSSSRWRRPRAPSGSGHLGRARPDREPPRLDRHDGDGHRRLHADAPRHPRARDDQRPHRGALRRAAHLQLPPHRRRRLRPAEAGATRRSSSSTTSTRSSSSSTGSSVQRDLHPPARERGRHPGPDGHRLRPRGPNLRGSAWTGSPARLPYGPWACRVHLEGEVVGAGRQGFYGTSATATTGITCAASR